MTYRHVSDSSMLLLTVKLLLKQLQSTGYDARNFQGGRVEMRGDTTLKSIYHKNGDLITKCSNGSLTSLIIWI